MKNMRSYEMGAVGIAIFLHPIAGLSHLWLCVCPIVDALEVWKADPNNGPGPKREVGIFSFKEGRLEYILRWKLKET